MFLNQTTATTWPWQPPISLSERATLIPQRRARILSKKWRVKEVPENSHERNEGGIKKCPPPPHKIWFAACDTKIQASHKSYATHWYISCHQAFPPISFPSPSPVTALAKPTLAETAASPALECESLAWPFGSVDPTSTMPPRAAFLEVEHVQSQLSRKALEHHQWVSCETSHVYETDLDCRWFFPLA